MQLQRIQSILKVSGEINMINATHEELDQFNQLIDSTLETIDFGSTTLADSLSVSMILVALRKKNITLVNLPQSIQQLIDLYELNSFVTS